jgi:cytochrome c551/c552
MIPCKPIGQRLTILLFTFFAFSTINEVAAQDGKAIFMSRCASCHKMGKDMTGPDLQGIISKWNGDVDHIKLWIRDFNKAVATGDERATSIVNFSPTAMQIFGNTISETELDAVIKYVDEWKPEVPTTGTTTDGEAKSSNQNAVIFGVISLILAVIALILMQVNSNLKKMSDDTEGIQRPEPVPFYRNKVYIAMASIIFFIVGGYYVTKGAIGLQRQKDYQPEQPIYYSHKVHAGLNQISCLYCHGAAMESKHAAIPSVNVCMNCHKAISSYEKGPKLYNEKGEEINGTAEIAKLYKFAGFDPKNPNAWDPSKAKPIEWIKIHNLPDHVYFNHSQHVKAGNVQCQTCHGEITAMDEVKQVSELSMGWCINCHRETKVNFNYDSTKGNRFYSIYEKFHNDLKPDTLRDAAGHPLKDRNGKYTIRPARMDSVTVKDIGGLECQKCHY